MRWRRPEILGITAMSKAKVAQEHVPGTEAEVDSREPWVILAGVKTKCFMFAYRLSPGVTAGRARIETTRWALFRSHYGFDAFSCEPGIDSYRPNHSKLTSS